MLATGYVAELGSTKYSAVSNILHSSCPGQFSRIPESHIVTSPHGVGGGVGSAELISFDGSNGGKPDESFDGSNDGFTVGF